MTSQQLERRRRVMRRSMMLGHCICDVRQPCPCDLFKRQSVCHCAGERVAPTGDTVRLTEHVRNAGCASKIDKSLLREVLADLPRFDDPRVLVGAVAGDDAGVVVLGSREDSATILTVDVFCPSVDAPYTFGQIAAANSLSDIYAMGGTPQVALSIIGFPVHVLPAVAMHEILRGGLDKMHEAGVSVVGGHSINDEEVKCGFAVVGTSPRDRLVRNAGARPGDLLVLTKPLGGGILAFAHQLGRAPAAAMDEAARSMASLNRLAGRAMLRHDAHAATDVTGFSLLGHLIEIVRNSEVEVVIDFDRLPLFPAVRDLARQDVLPGAVERNRESVSQELIDFGSLSPAQQAVLFGPETSGGMLVFLSPTDADGYIAELQAGGVEARVVGEVVAGRAGGRIRVRSEQVDRWTGAESRRGDDADPAAPAQPQGRSCCSETPLPPQAPPEATSGADGLPAAAGGDALKAYMNSVNAPGALGTKAKKLIGLALSVQGRCEPCVVANADAARAAGASDREIAEAAALGIAFGGAPAAMFYETLRKRNGVGSASGNGTPGGGG